MLASSLSLEYPLNDALPNIDNARDRLLAKIFRFRKEEKDAAGATDQDFELLYAYGKIPPTAPGVFFSRFDYLVHNIYIYS